VPLPLKLKALELLDIHDRAVEEVGRVSDDIWCTLIHFSDMHESLSLDVTAATTIGARALVLRQLAVLEQFLRELWMVVGKYVNVPPPPTYQTLSLLPEAVQETNDDNNDILLDSDSDVSDDDDTTDE